MTNGTSVRWFVLKNYSVKRCSFALFLIFVFDILYIASKSSLFGIDALTLLYYGYPSGHFVFADLLFFLIFNFIPLYFSAVTLDSKAINAGDQVLTRMKKKSDYYLNLQLSFGFFLLLYFLIHILAAVTYNVLFVEPSLWFSDVSRLMYDIPDERIKILVLVSGIVLRFGELLFMQKVLVLIHSVFGNLSAEFVALLVGYFLISIVNWNLYPFGLSSIARILSHEGDPVIYIIAVALIYVVCSIIADIYVSKKRIYNLLER